MSETAHKVVIQAVRHIQTESVNVKFFNPSAHAVQQIIGYGRILKVQLHQLIMSFPAFVPEAIVVAAVAVKADVKPVFIWRIPFLFLHIAECPESSSYMIEYAVQHDADTMLMKCAADICKIFIRAKTTVNRTEISGVVAMIV